MRSMTRWVGFSWRSALRRSQWPTVRARREPTKAAVCVACHGPNGNSANEQWPSLAGQNAVYIVISSSIFTTRPASTAQCRDATDGRGLERPGHARHRPPISRRRRPPASRRIPPTGRPGSSSTAAATPRARFRPAWPAMARSDAAIPPPAIRHCEAQHAVYTVAQLTRLRRRQALYAQTTRATATADPNAQIMHTSRAALTPQDMRNLASYVQGMR